MVFSGVQVISVCRSEHPVPHSRHQAVTPTTGLCLFWKKLLGSSFQKEALRLCCPTLKCCCLSRVVCGRPSRPSPSLGARLCCTWSWQLPSHPHFPEGPHLLSEGGGSQACRCTSFLPRLGPGWSCSQATPCVGNSAQTSGRGFLGRGRAVSLWLGFSLCLCVCLREVGQAEPTGKQARWKDGG